MKKELQEKRDKYDDKARLLEFKNKVGKITFDISPIKKQQAKVIQKIDRLVETAAPKIRKDEAEYILGLFRHNLEDIGDEARVALDNELNNGVRKSCEGIISEYEEYIRTLDSDGIFNIGSFDMRQTDNFEAFFNRLGLNAYAHQAIKDGVFNAIGRFLFGWAGVGYETIDDYEEQKVINLRELIEDQVQNIKHSFDKEMNDAIEENEKKVERIKAITMSKLEGLDKLVAELMDEIDKMLVSQEKLQKKVKENEEKTQWIKDFVQQVGDLLTV